MPYNHVQKPPEKLHKRYTYKRNVLSSLTPSRRWLSRLALQNPQTTSLERGKTPPTSIPDMTLNNQTV